MKLLAKNIISENIKMFSLNHINKLLYNVAGFIKFLIKTIANIVASNSNANSAPLDKTGGNPSINPAIQLNDDISNDKIYINPAPVTMTPSLIKMLLLIPKIIVTINLVLV